MICRCSFQIPTMIFRYCFGFFRDSFFQKYKKLYQKMFSCHSCKNILPKIWSNQGPARLGGQKTEPICIGHTSTKNAIFWTCRVSFLNEKTKDIWNQWTQVSPTTPIKGQLYIKYVGWDPFAFCLRTTKSSISPFSSKSEAAKVLLLNP